ncbi:MAG: PepSY domain-containing protein [Candidatus Heimdallarchaeota archaeon]|nr:PepSY domain-containing protein [Candidatus Heimdallarchaeota archaeon]
MTTMEGLARTGVKNLGNLSLILMGIGSTYILLRRSYVYSKRYLVIEKYQPLKKNIANFYRKSKGPMLTLHNITMVIATIFAVIHGIFLEDDFKAIGITGWIAAILMIVLSISGLIIWAKFRPIWEFRTARTHLRFVHQQWLFSGIMVIPLILHTIVLED